MKQNYNSNYTNGKASYLNINYHYYGMNKIKAGRGYKTGKPLGVESGECQSDECNGTIITLRINTSVKGFETSTEKVCDTCGRVYPLGFQIIGKPQVSVEMNKWSSHKEWKTAMMQSQSGPDIDEGIDNNLEAQSNWNGCRLNTIDAQSYDSQGIGIPNKTANVNIEYKSRLRDAEERLSKTPQSMHIPSQTRKEHEYNLLVDDYAHELGMMKYQIEDVKHILKHRGSEFNTKYPMEDVILCICLFTISKQIDYRRFNALLGRTIRNPRVTSDIKSLYPLVKQKLTT